MKETTTILVLCLAVISLTQCSDFLDVKPQGIVPADDAGKPETVDGLVIAAYSWIPAQTYSCCSGSRISRYLTVDMLSGDTYKGGAGISDQYPWYIMETFTNLTPQVDNNDGSWFAYYQGISRTNTAIRALENVEESEYPMKTERIAEMRFLRGRMYLKLKMRYRWIPYFRENASATEIEEISNHPDSVESDIYLWKKILEDFQYAYEHLPPTQEDEGRPTKWAAAAQAAYVLLWMAYPQNAKNQVTGINENRLQQALEYLNPIINSGQFRLTSQYGHIFLASYDSQNESTPGEIFSWQYSHQDGTDGTGNLNGGTQLNAPTWPPYYSCCDFHKPTYKVVNIFRTRGNGLPMFKNFNNTSAHHNYTPYFSNNTFDPRVGHTVAIPGLPWKYQTELLYDSSGSRTPAVYGYFHTLKDQLQTDSPATYNYFWMWDAKDVGIIRYDMVLLHKAEALIQLGRQDEALPIINKIRQRAANSTKLLKFANGEPTLNYNIALYKPGVNCTWTQEYAWEALKFEYHLEFATEGMRWHNMVRWGIVDEVMNKHFEIEEDRGREWLQNAHFTNGTNEYMPIPQNQMNWAKGLYKQNHGY